MTSDAAEPLDASPNNGQLRALLVEDEPDFINLLTHHVGRLGYLCTETSNGLDARSILASSDLDLLVTDMLLPGMGGADLIDWLRHQDRGWTTAVVVVSILEPLDTTRALADVVLIKPFQSAQLISAIRQAELLLSERAAGVRHPPSDL